MRRPFKNSQKRQWLRLASAVIAIAARNFCAAKFYPSIYFVERCFIARKTYHNLKAAVQDFPRFTACFALSPSAKNPRLGGDDCFFRAKGWPL
jgi:hypothetical protein